jgi:hypothetical protein
MTVILVMLSVDMQAIKLGCGLDVMAFDTQQGREIFLFSKMFTPALGTTQPFIQWILEAVFPQA